MSALRLERLGVRRMPGVRDAGFDLDDLSPGLNLVHGPNASGKTTTADAIAALLWPRVADARAWVTAALHHEGAQWTVEVEARRARYQRDGIDAPALAGPPAEARDRYRLSLAELLQSDNTGLDLAAAIARESAGGYDLGAAERTLGARRSASQCRKELEALGAARAKLAEARSAETALRTEERELNDLGARLEGRAALTTRVERLERAVEHASARAEHERAAQEQATFDVRRERLHGDEAERLREIDARRADCVRAADTAGAARERALADLAACALPDAGLPGELLAALRAEHDALREQERVIAAKQQALVEAESERARHRDAIGSVIDEARLRQIDTAAVAGVAAFAREGEKLAAEHAAAASERDAHAPAAGASALADRQPLERGVHLLRHWLRGAEGDVTVERRLRAFGITAAVLLTLAGAALGLVTPLFALTAAAGLVLLVLIARPAARVDVRAAPRAEYARLGLEQPDAWTADAVEAVLDRLEQAVAAARLEEERALRRSDAERRLAALAPRLAAHAAQRAEAAARLGVALDTPAVALVWLIDRIGQWHTAQAKAGAAAAALAEAQRQSEARARGAALRAVGYTHAAALDASALAGLISSLEARQKAHDAAALRLQQADTAREQARSAAAEADAMARAIHTRLGTDAADLALIEAWCADHTRFQQARERLRVTASLLAEKADRLAALGGEGTSLLDAAEAELTAQLEGARAEAVALAAMHDRAVEIGTRLGDARKAHAVEDALAEVDRAEHTLREARERDRRAGLAAVLIDHVRAATRDQHLPAVFHRARELFTTITRGRYRLDFGDDAPAAFRAYDTATGVGHLLGELSSGSRVQLLLAVRLAFVETQEHGIHLPLLLDETLGNSDDERALAIMHAVLELAASGRQIFYFTAQPDEVGKWCGLLEERPDVPHRVIDLAAVRRIARRLDVGRLRIVAPPAATVPVPDGCDHAEYAGRLGVPVLGRFDTADAAHLWYLVDEPAALYDLLTAPGVEQWGPLRELLERGVCALGPTLAARLQARAQLLDRALALHRVGHGRPVDRDVLVASGAVSDTFMARLTDLCRALDGDARRLLDAIDRGEVARFQTRARDRLSHYLEGHGYLDPREPLDAAAIHADLLATAAVDLRAGVLRVECIDGLLARLHAARRGSTAPLAGAE